MKHSLTHFIHDWRGIVAGLGTTLLIAGVAFYIAQAAHTVTVSVDRTLAKGNTQQAYTFTVNNNNESPNFVYYVKVTAPVGFSISATGVTCPTNFGVSTVLAPNAIECLGDANPNNNKRIMAGTSATIGFNATAASTDGDFDWVIRTDDNAFETVNSSATTHVDATAPGIELEGATTQVVELGDAYEEAGATAEDNLDGTIDPDSIVIDSSAVNTNVVGSYTVTYNVSDTAGNPAIEVVRTVNVEDHTDPTVVLTDDHADAIVRDVDTVVITATFTDLGGIDETPLPTISIGDVVTNADMTKVSNLVWTYTWDVPDGNDGDVAVAVSAMDNSGNANATVTGQTSYTIDNTAPAVPVITDPATAKSVNADIYTVRGTAEANAFVKFYSGASLVGEAQQLLNGATDFSSSLPLTQNGVNDFTVTATDIAGNEGSAATVSTITEDSVFPTLTTYTIDNTAISPQASSGVQDSTNIDIEFSETSTYTIKVKQGETLIKTLQSTSTAMNPGVKNWDGTDDDGIQVTGGTYTIEIIFKDAADNSVTDTSQTIIVDNTAPTIGAFSPASNAYTQSAMPTISAVIEGNGSGINTATIVMTIDAGTVSPVYEAGTVSFTPGSALTDGSHPITVDVTDNAGNPAPQASWLFTVDTIDPQVTINTGFIETPTAFTTQEIIGEYTEENLFTITVNDVQADASEGSWSADISLNEGQNTITVTATDRAGRTREATTVIVLDTTDPVVDAGVDRTVNNEFTQNATVTDASADLTYDWIKVSGPGTVIFTPGDIKDTAIAADEDGVYVVQLTVTDEVGNSGSDTVSFIWDETPPSTPTLALADPINIGNSTTVDLTISGEANAAATYSIHDSGVASTPGATVVLNSSGSATVTVDLSALADGTITAIATVTDAAGNESDEGTDTATKDTDAPSAPVITSIAGNNYINNTEKATIVVVGTAEAGAIVNVTLADGSVIVGGFGTATGGNYSITLDGTTLADGALTVQVTAIDPAGNVSPATTSPTAVKDIVAPTVISQSPSAGSTSVSPANSITLTFSESMAISAGNVSLTPSAEFAFSYDADTRTVTVDPNANLANNTPYTVSISTSATDSAGNAIAAYSAQFTTSALYSVPLSNNLGQKWNLVSLPVIPASTAIADVLGSEASNINAVWSYNPATGEWLVYRPAAEPELSTLSTVTAGYGYWIEYNGTSGMLSGSGTVLGAVGSAPAVPPSRELKKGWNLVGYYQAPGTTSVPMSTVFQSINGSWTRALGYDNTNKTWSALYDTGNAPDVTVAPGEAFWLLATQDAIYSF